MLNFICFEACSNSQWIKITNHTWWVGRPQPQLVIFIYQVIFYFLMRVKFLYTKEEEGRNPHLASSRRIDPLCLNFGDCLVGVWRVYGNCLEGVWQVSGGCLVGVWRVS